jgi:predicted HTH domain antitoxin
MQVTLELPEDIAKGLESKWKDLTRAALESLALEAYRSGALTSAQVRRLLGFQTRYELDGFLKEHGVYLDYDIADLERDVANSREFSRQP